MKGLIFNCFSSWASWFALDVSKSNCDEYLSVQTKLCKKAFEAGQQSKQAEVDELQNKIDEALKLLNLAYPESWAYCVDEAINILKEERS